MWIWSNTKWKPKEEKVGGGNLSCWHMGTPFSSDRPELHSVSERPFDCWQEFHRFCWMAVSSDGVMDGRLLHSGSKLAPFHWVQNSAWPPASQLLASLQADAKQLQDEVEECNSKSMLQMISRSWILHIFKQLYFFTLLWSTIFVDVGFYLKHGINIELDYKITHPQRICQCWASAREVLILKHIEYKKTFLWIKQVCNYMRTFVTSFCVIFSESE